MSIWLRKQQIYRYSSHYFYQWCVQSLWQSRICIKHIFAFDTIDHNILLSKLEHYGIRNTSLSLFKSYLSNRMQYVLCNKKASSMQSITYGVPQGSILGPVLFLLYINDIVSTSSFFKFILYADDSNIYASGPSLHHLITMANEELKKILKWLLSNKLTLNTEKSHFLIFNRNKVIPNDLP